MVNSRMASPINDRYENEGMYASSTEPESQDEEKHEEWVAREIAREAYHKQAQ